LAVHKATEWLTWKGMAERLNIYALVIYVPEPLGEFLDDLRRELVPHYNPHAHVSVLPPRPLAVDWQTASAQLRAAADRWNVFHVKLTQIEIFPVTNVVFIQIGDGAEQLNRMHAEVNRDGLEFQEPFVYHPHITLAQEIPPENVREVHELARRRWAEYRGSREFRADRAVFVQNTAGNCWVDLAAYTFGKSGTKS
jgi:2'-5' RNA ligase